MQTNGYYRIKNEGTGFYLKVAGDSSAEDQFIKVYNILGDYPDVISDFMVEKIIKNTKNNVKFNWLTNTKAAYRFATAGFNKRNFFK